MKNNFLISPIVELELHHIEPLIKASEKEEFKFLTRLKNDWISGVNRFNKKYEKLYQIEVDKKIIAIGGINNNPYHENGKVGRIRHLYVLSEYRKRGFGRKLVQHLLNKSNDKYEKITLRTDTVVASKFYESIGFKRINSKNSSHQYIL